MSWSPKTVLGALALSVGVAAQAAPVTIDFDDLGSGVVVGAHYAGLGVSFVDAETGGFGSLPGGSAPMAIVHDSSFSTFGPSDPIVALFASAVDLVSLTALDVGEAGFMITAYDALVGGNVVDSASHTGVGIGIGAFHTLTVSGSGIQRIEFSQISAGQGGDGVAFDDLVFDRRLGVPEPGALGLVLLGLVGAIWSRRRA